MKKINIILASSTAAMLLASAPLLASAHTGSDTSGKGNLNIKADLNTNAGLHVGQLFHWGDDKNKDKDTNHATSTKKDMGVVAGVVTSVNGNIVTIKPFGTKATTTVTTNASTIFRTKGGTTSTNALVVGAKVLAVGTSTAATNISASFIGIFTRGFGFFKHLLFR